MYRPTSYAMFYGRVVLYTRGFKFWWQNDVLNLISCSLSRARDLKMIVTLSYDSLHDDRQLDYQWLRAALGLNHSIDPHVNNIAYI